MTDLRTPDNAASDELIDEDDLVAADDRIIGKAFLWSLTILLGLGGLIGVMIWALHRPAAVIAESRREFVPPRLMEAPAKPPDVHCTDITSAAGVDFIHINGAGGEKLLPETMGGGCAFLDYDNDGAQDMLLISSTTWDVYAGRQAAGPSSMALYRNDGLGHFANVTHEADLDAAFYGMGVACGDYDNDGDVDVFVSALGPNHLFRNDGGHFADVAKQAGVAGDSAAWSTSCGFVDYDNDGDLDLFVCNYVKWSREIDFAVNYTLDGTHRAYGQPTNFEGANSYLYRNNGDGTYTDVSAMAGIQISGIEGRPMGKALGLAPADVDRDGWIDLFVANDTVQRFFFHNKGDGTFAEEGAEWGLAFDRNGNATGAMGVDCADYRNDATLGFVVGNFANEMSSLLVSQGDPRQFADEAITEGIGAPTRLKLTFGAFFFDYDLDGWLDLLHANGHIEDHINLVQPSQHYEQAAQLFWNAGAGASACFAEAPTESTGDLARPIVGRGAAFADIDGDGDLDILLTQIAGRPLLLRNDQNLKHHWLRVKLVGNGRSVNRDAIGALIELTAGGVTQTRQVMPTRSYLSQVELPVTFGLGDGDRVQRLQILWPDGTRQLIEQGTVDATVTIRQSP